VCVSSERSTCCVNGSHCPCQWWVRFTSAHRLLAGLNIGPMLRDSSGSLGHIDFVDGACPGNDHIGAHVHDDVSLSLLQVRLNDLRAGIGIRLAQARISRTRARLPRRSPARERLSRRRS
jgi:hypothetical protein